MAGRFFKESESGALSIAGPGVLTLGRGEGRNSSIRSVSGTGSMLDEVCGVLGKAGRSAEEECMWNRGRLVAARALADTNGSCLQVDLARLDNPRHV